MLQDTNPYFFPLFHYYEKGLIFKYENMHILGNNIQILKMKTSRLE